MTRIDYSLAPAGPQTLLSLDPHAVELFPLHVVLVRPPAPAALVEGVALAQLLPLLDGVGQLVVGGLW